MKFKNRIKGIDITFDDGDKETDDIIDCTFSKEFCDEADELLVKHALDILELRNKSMFSKEALARFKRIYKKIFGE